MPITLHDGHFEKWLMSRKCKTVFCVIPDEDTVHSQVKQNQLYGIGSPLLYSKVGFFTDFMLVKVVYNGTEHITRKNIISLALFVFMLMGNVKQ